MPLAEKSSHTERAENRITASFVWCFQFTVLTLLAYNNPVRESKCYGVSFKVKSKAKTGCNQKFPGNSYKSSIKYSLKGLVIATK